MAFLAGLGALTGLLPSVGGAFSGVGGALAGGAKALLSNPQTMMGLGSLMSGGSNVAGTIAGLIGGGKKSAGWNERLWASQLGNTNKAMSQLFFLPQVEGQMSPYSIHAKPGERTYKWAPSESMKQIYSGYLNRSYGVPNAIASAMAANAISSVGAQRKAMDQLVTPAAISGGMATDPRALANALVQSQAPEFLGERDMAKTAAELAAFNLWRVKKFGDLIG